MVVSAPTFLHACVDGVQIAIKLQPRASKNEMGEAIGNELKIRISAPPVDSAANQALLDFLAESFACPRSAVQLVRGRTSRHKTILVRGMSAESILERIAAASRDGSPGNTSEAENPARWVA